MSSVSLLKLRPAPLITAPNNDNIHHHVTELETMQSTPFELFLLDHRSSSNVIALARRGADTAIEHIAISSTLIGLRDFGRQLGKAITGNSGQRPSAKELLDFGEQLFNFLFQGSLRQLYDRLPAGPVSLQILSDRTEIRETPWEYMVTPDCQPSPHRDRSVVRIHPTCGIDSPTPKKITQGIKVLFVSADPIDGQAVSSQEVLNKIQRSFDSQRVGSVFIKVVLGATRLSLINTIMQEEFDVFHFLGHGGTSNNVGHLALEDIDNHSSDIISASELATILAGKSVQLAILSACESGNGNHSDDFGVVATALIRAKIPAVVANQYPIPQESIPHFVRALYISLMQDGDIDRAVAEGRVNLDFLTPPPLQGRAKIEWGIPALYRLATSRYLFQP